MKKGLFALALGTFTLGIAEFIIEGIITDIANNMNVSIPEAGHLISIYALGVCAGAFSLILMHKYRPFLPERKQVRPCRNILSHCR